VHQSATRAACFGYVARAAYCAALERANKDNESRSGFRALRRTGELRHTRYWLNVDERP
jgi:hypothetical protein